MRRPFEPLTVGYDWEMAVLKPSGENVREKDVVELGDVLRARLPWAETGTDLELLESRVGSVRSFGELLRKSERFDAALREELGRRGWELLRLGARPFQMEPVGAHIHVGTVRSTRDAIGVQNGMIRYTAALAALAANSAVYRGLSGRFKSYRVASFAEGCSTPQGVLRPEMSQWSWGTDVNAKHTWGPTVELRVPDCAGSTRLLCEMAALTAGLMVHVGENERDREVTLGEYDEFIANRWRAARHGLQAVFVVGGRHVEVGSLLTDMVEVAQDGMRRFGAAPRDLRTIRTMVRKRQTQADFQQALLALDRGDPYRFTRTMMSVQRDPRAFERYLRSAPTLPAVESDDHDRFLLEHIEVETPYPLLLRATPLGPDALDLLLDRFVREGAVVEGRTPLGVRTYTRQGMTGADTSA
jgi:gamma-glutamyl:cysteine ligase YbdK (ATP-grasp superfamily)